MASSYLSHRMASRVAAPHTIHAFDMASPEYTQRSSTSPSIPLADVMTANENWRGKNDPTERRRIQNRLNQRAFRQRQRAGESPKQYKRRVSSDCSNSQANDSDDEVDSQHSEDSADPNLHPTDSAYSSGSINDRPAGTVNPQTGQIWDELAQIINRNFLSAAVTNAQHLGLNLTALRTGAAVKTPQPRNLNHITPSLRPINLQYQMPHDPIIDTIPHAMLRYNILRAIASREIDAVVFSRCFRASGALEQLNGSWQRVGVVMWNSSPPELVASWELSELFVRRWGGLLRGCEDLIAATNVWRARRGERLLSASVA